MIIALFLAGLIWVWFHHGLLMALVLLVSLTSVLLLLVVKRASAVLFVVLASAVLLQLELQQRHALPLHWQHQNAVLGVCLEQAPQRYEDNAQAALGRVVSQPTDLSLRRIKFWAYPETEIPQLDVGDCIEAEVRLRQPLGRLIPGIFNADRYNFSVGIDAYGTLISINRLTSSADLPQRLYLQVAQILESENALDLWAALTLGWSRALNSDLKSVLADNQLMHLFVISGMHLAFIALLINGVIWLLARAVSPWLQFQRVQRHLLLMSIVVAYVAFLGFPVPVTRALIMLGIPLLSEYLALRWGRFSALGSAAVLLMVWQPASWLALGPWLSFVSVLVILLMTYWRLINRYPWLVRLFLFQLIMTASVLPWAIVAGFSFNPVSLLSSLLLTFIVGFVALPLAFLLMFGVPLTAEFWQSGVEWLLPILRWATQSGISMDYVGFWPVVLSICLVAWLIWWRGLLSGLYLMPMALVWLLASRDISVEPIPRLVLYDVGHGQAVLLDSGDHRILYDTAGRFSPTVSLAEASLGRVLPSLSGLVVSHSDSDHAAGVGYFRRVYPGMPIWTGQPERLPDSKSMINCHKQDMQFAEFQFIRIPPILRQGSDNNQSCVLLADLGGYRVLITGDADKYTEYFLLQNYPELFPVDVLILGHHGSKSSSAGAFLTRNSSALFLVSSGDRLAPSWPAERIEHWFDKHQRALFNSAQRGTIELHFRPEGIQMKTWDTAYRNHLIY